ncbi:hypothetical protein H2199_002237 [Coniosporium tulheliwenetii]|uniref:Uncharacterized protein n=1 Tax=Coniosporium tulheliwenetii TaxID=3383036 RepID=A0ACC2ZI79_9PEZI|nr:hypothetical protein H2199_002237 [Cladosporium sp. JES 115]
MQAPKHRSISEDDRERRRRGDDRPTEAEKKQEQKPIQKPRTPKTAKEEQEQREEPGARQKEQEKTRGQQSSLYEPATAQSRIPSQRPRAQISAALTKPIPLSTSPPPPPRSRAALPDQATAFHDDTPSAPLPPPEKQKPNLNPTGLLAKETNTVSIGGASIVLKYNEPSDARKPSASTPWRLYVFKGRDILDTIPLHTRSCWLIGREERVADLPYVIDLESSNGTRLNGERVEASRFVELRDGDVLGFGESEREYVVMLPPADEKG